MSTGSPVAAATRRVSRAVEMDPTWTRMLVATADSKVPCGGSSARPSDTTRSVYAASTSGAEVPSRIAGQS